MMSAKNTNIRNLTSRISKAKMNGNLELVNTLKAERDELNKAKPKTVRGKRQMSETSVAGITSSTTWSASEEQKSTLEFEQSVVATKKQKSIHSVETSTTVRQVNNGEPETIKETVTVSFFFHCCL